MRWIHLLLFYLGLCWYEWVGLHVNAGTTSPRRGWGALCWDLCGIPEHRKWNGDLPPNVLHLGRYIRQNRNDSKTVQILRWSQYFVTLKISNLFASSLFSLFSFCLRKCPAVDLANFRTYFYESTFAYVFILPFSIVFTWCGLRLNLPWDMW